MTDKAKLAKMMDNIINNRPEQAQLDFRAYLQAKMQEVLRDRQVTNSQQHPLPPQRTK